MSEESSRNAAEDCPRCGNETTTDALTYQGCPDCQAEIAGYRAAEASSRNAAEMEAVMASPNRPGYCRPEWGCRWCKAGECGWDARRPTETPHLWTCRCGQTVSYRYLGCPSCHAKRPTETPRNPCHECDGLGYYTIWPHTSCPACNGTGAEPRRPTETLCVNCGQPEGEHVHKGAEFVCSAAYPGDNPSTWRPTETRQCD